MRLVVMMALALLAAALGVFPASAQVPPPPPPPHEHVLTTPTGPVDVGPPRCGNERLQGAFLKFHFKVHLGAPPTVIEPRFC
jgi:Spy/CpxP family protein refolding chaperone